MNKAFALLLALEKSPTLLNNLDEREVCNALKAIIAPKTAWPPFSTISYTFQLPQEIARAHSLLENQPNFVNKEIPLLELPPLSQTLIRESFQWWENTANLRFIETTQDPTIYIYAFNEINKNLTSSSTAGFSTLGTKINPWHVFALNQKRLPSTHPSYQSEIFLRILFHESGHTLSLKHPFTFPFTVTENKFNNTNFTIMAYNTVINPNTQRKINTISPLPVDIDAVQLLYGKNLTSRTGNDIYYLSNFTTSSKDDTESLASLPWDADGIDTLTAGAIYEDVILDIRPYGKSSNNDGTVMTPNISIENVVGGYGTNQIYLNGLDNEVDVRFSQQTTLFIEARHTGKDKITGFHPKRDKMVLLDTTQSGTWQIKQISLPNDAYRNATLIEFDSKNSITLLDVNADEMHSDSIKINPVLTENSELDRNCQFSPNSNALSEALNNIPSQLTHDFLNAFSNGSALTFLDGLTVDFLQYYQCHPDNIESVQNALYVCYLFYSGTFFPNAVGYLVAEILIEQFKMSDQCAKQAAVCLTTTAHIAQNFTPLGVARTFMNMAGGLAGSVFTLWARDKIKSRIGSLITSIKEDEIDLELGNYINLKQLN